ncbi:MAG: nucleotidyltransferase domain-containing protein [Deltaproteobacteria bacterium]|nr:nucleotidyltransferase domain-containing protein [Deltaproteobacteria bacterium]
MLSPGDENIVRALKERLREAAGDRLQAVIVYGSRVWGGADSDSDLDVVAIVRDCTPELEAAFLEAAYQVMWDYDFTPLISLKISDSLSYDACLGKCFSFYRKVAQEGVTL